MASPADIPLAITGMACRLPGAPDLNAYWQLLVEGGCELGPIPEDRFNRELFFDPVNKSKTKSYTELAGVTPDTPFDTARYPLAQSLVDSSHIAHQKLYCVAVDAWRHANWHSAAQADRRVGVYVGHTPPSSLAGGVLFARQIGHTARWLAECPQFAEQLGADGPAVINSLIDTFRNELPADDNRHRMCAGAFRAAELISRGLQLDGPSMSFDAACASSLRAFSAAARALQLGQIDSAVVGSASYVHSDCLVLFSQAQSVSRTGSRPFDADADGLVASEGYVAVCLKTLDRAIADGDTVHAVIRGIGVSSDGRGKSLWAPRAEGQLLAIQRAYRNGLSPADMQYIEMHATSTQVGDATEMDALTRAFADLPPVAQKILVGSVKANVGHSLESAGLASLVKTVLSMTHGQIPQQIKLNTPNPSIGWDRIPFAIPQATLDWPALPAGTPRRAAVNAFGIGGLNVHVVLEQHQSNATAAPVHSGSNRRTATPTIAFDEPIAIIGRGTILPGVRTIAALEAVLQSGQSQIREVPSSRWDKSLGVTAADEKSNNDVWQTSHTHGGFITDFEYDWKKHRVPPRQIQTADPLQFMFLDAADQALADAGYDQREFDKTRTGVVVGTIFCGEFNDQLQVGLNLPRFERTFRQLLSERNVPADLHDGLFAEYEKLLLQRMPALLDETGSFTASTLASRLTKTFDLMGGATAVDAGDASAAAALDTCVNILRAGDADMLLCASGHRAMGVASFIGRKLTHADVAGSPDVVPGEGVGVLLLKRLSDARRDGDTIHGIICHIGVARDDDPATATRLAAERCLQSANVTAADVAVTAGSACGDNQRDAAELKTLKKTYQAAVAQIGLLQPSQQFGHTGGATPVIEILAAARKLKEVTHAPTAQTPQLDGRVFAGISATAQTGVAYHILLESPQRLPVKTQVYDANTRSHSQPAPVISPATAWRIVRLGADSLDELKTGAESLSQSAEAAFTDTEQSRFSATDRYRLAIVANSAAELAKKATLAAKQVGNPQATPLLQEKGIFARIFDGRPPQLVFAFPGQGSQYTGMLQELIAECPPAAAAHAEVDAVLAELHLPSFATLAWSEDNGLGDDIWQTQLSLLAADTIMFAAVSSLGFTPDRFCGHSFGELAALVATKAWTFQDAVLATRARCDAISQYAASAGQLVSTSAPADVLIRLCREVSQQPGLGSITVSHVNSQDQTVAGGDPTAVQALAAKVAEQGYKSKVLNVPAAFHTPLMEAVRQPFGDALATIKLLPPRTPLFSSVTNRYVADPLSIRENLAAQMTQPVLWQSLAERLQSEGPCVFVEVGPRQVLTGLHKRIFADVPADAANHVLCVGSDHPKRPGMEQLLHVQAACEVAGLDETVPSPLPTRLDDTPADVTNSVVALPQQAVEYDQNAALPVLRIQGSAYEIGRAHGQALAAEIQQILRTAIGLTGSRWDTVLNVTGLVNDAQELFGSDALAELRGIADGAGVNVESLIAHNLRFGHTTGAGGWHAAVTAGVNQPHGLLHAVAEEHRAALAFRDGLGRQLQVRRAERGFPVVSGSFPGRVGTSFGANSAGLTASVAVFEQATKSRIGAYGKLPTVLLSELLQTVDSLNAAREFLSDSRVAGSVGICVTDAHADRVLLAEHSAGVWQFDENSPRVVAANQSVLSHETQTAEPAATARWLQLFTHFGDAAGSVSVADAQAALGDIIGGRTVSESTPASATLKTLRRVDNQAGCVFAPNADKVWMTAGPADGNAGEVFHEFRLSELFGSHPQQSAITTGSNEESDLKRDEPSRELFMTGTELRAAFAASEQRRSAGVSDVCERLVLRLQKLNPPTPETQRTIAGNSFLLVGSGAVTAALKARIKQAGGTVEVIAPSSVEHVLAEIDAAWSERALPNLLLIDDVPDVGIRQIVTHMQPMYAACQCWYQRVLADKLLPTASILAVTQLGGDFGLRGQVQSSRGGALAGLVKGVVMEVEMARQQPAFRGRVIDISPSTAADDVAEFALREWSADDAENEIGYINGVRVGVRSVPVALTSNAAELPHGGVVIVTGGARGVTAEVAREFGRRTGAKLYLVGSSRPPEVPDAWHGFNETERGEFKAALMKEAIADGLRPMDAWQKFEKALEMQRNLQTFADAGVAATYHACDIGNRDEVDKLLQRIRTADGPVTGIIHGAGFEKAASFEKKKPELVALTLSAKVGGAVNLLELTASDPLAFFIGFGSVSGRFGGVGQTDYCAANDQLAKVIDRLRVQRPDTNAAVFHWHAWDDVGMAVRPESKHIAKLHNIRFMPAREGCEHLLNELAAGLPECEVAITETSFVGQKFLQTADAAETNEPDTAVPARTPARRFRETQSVSDSLNATQVGTPAVRENAVTTSMEQPMVDAVLQHDGERSVRTEWLLDPVQDPFLQQHNYKGRPLLPIVAGLEAMAEAATLLARRGERVTRIRDIQIVAGLRFPTGTAMSACVQATREGDGIHTDLTCDFKNTRGQLLLKDKPYLRARVDVGVSELDTTSVPLPTADVEWHDCRYPDEGVAILHGPAFRGLSQIAFGDGVAWAKIQLPDAAEFTGPQRAGEMLTMPVLLDSVFYACGVYLWQQRGGVVAIPAAIEAISFASQKLTDREFLAFIEPVPSSTSAGTAEANAAADRAVGGRAQFRVRVLTAAGQPVCRVDGYENIIVETATHAQS